MTSLMKGFLRAFGRAKAYWMVAAGVRSSFLLCLFSNHRTSALAATLNGKRGIKVRSAGKAPIFIDLNSGDHRTIFREIFIEQVYVLDHVPFRPQVILDCGAHIGLFSRLAAAVYPGTPIHAFEPNAINFGWLKRQCGYANCNINPIQGGVDVRDGVGILFGDGCQGTMLA
jgi:hypothetical protein